MAIVQISKIQHRTGANLDLPQLDIGEIGFATDEQKLYIGNDPLLVPLSGSNTTTQTEILTEVSLINKRDTVDNTIIHAKIAGLANATFNVTNLVTGQILVADGATVTANSITNWTGNKVGSGSNVKLKLGSAANISITGGTSGQVLTTDGAGNVSWATGGGGGGSATLPSQTSANGNFLLSQTGIAVWSNVFSDNRFANTVRGNINVGYVSGFGNLSYNSSNGVISYTGVSTSDIRAQFTGNLGVTITNGNIDIGQDVSNTAQVQFDTIKINQVTVDGLYQGTLSGNDRAIPYVGTSNLLTTEADFYYNDTTNTLNVGRLLVTGNANLGNSATANYLIGTLTTAAQPNITSIGTLSNVNTSNLNLNWNGGANTYRIFANSTGLFVEDTSDNSFYAIGLTPV